MMNLPEIFVPHAWRFLRTPPPVADPQLAGKMQALVVYFERTWMTDSLSYRSFPAPLWSHYDHTWPRTTNNAEGWHNSMNHIFGVSHPSQTSFLNWQHRNQFEVQCRGLQLAAGRSAKPREAKYVKLDQDIMQAKVILSMRLGNIFLQFPTDWGRVEWELSMYLAHVAYLCGIK